MALPKKLEGSRYRVLRIRNCYTVYQTNGLKKLVENVFYYGPGAYCDSGPNAFDAGSKTLLVTYSTGAADAGGTTRYGFQSTVLLVLNPLLNKGALSGGIFAKWLDVVTDFDQQVGTYAPSLPQTSSSVGNGSTQGGGYGAIATRLPLDNHVTVRKFTGVAGREWSKGRWKFAPIDEGQTSGDELDATAQTAWGTTVVTPPGYSLKQALYAPITDGTSTGGVLNLLYPILVSTKLSQLQRAPTRIAYAPLILPGINYITQVTNQIINATIGEQKSRKEKPDITF